MRAPISWALAKSSAGVLLEENMTSSPSKPTAFASISSVSEEQSAPQPSSFRILRIKGLGVAFTAKYSLNPGFQENALRSARAVLRMPASS